jgi:hypothetical protein
MGSTDHKQIKMTVHLDRLWFGLPFLISFLALVAPLKSGKILNAPGANPMIVDRSDNPEAFWPQVVLRVLFVAVTGWMAAAVIFHAP